MSAVQSPLFEPVLWESNGFKILDELQIPDKVEYLEVKEVGQALAAVREPWEPESTAYNLSLIREARAARGETVEWADELEAELLRAASSD